MKAHTATPAQQNATHTAPHTFGITAHGDTITARAFDLLYGHTDVAVIDVPDAGAFLTAHTALALADLIAADVQLATLIRQRDTLGGAA